MYMRGSGLSHPDSRQEDGTAAMIKSVFYIACPDPGISTPTSRRFQANGLDWR